MNSQKFPTCFFTFYPNLYALSLVGNTLLCKCAPYTLVASHVWLSELSLHILTRLLTSGHCMIVFVCLSLVFVFVFCICFFVFVSVSVFVRPLSSSLSSFMLIIIIYLCNRNLSSPSSAPYTRILLLQNFNKLSATLNVKLILPSYWLSFCQSSNQQAVTLVCSIYSSRIVPRESNAHGYLYFPFQSLYKCSKHETRNWINMWIIILY